MSWRLLLEPVDRKLLSVPIGVRWLILALTLIVVALQSVPHIPKIAFDFSQSQFTMLRGISQPDMYGTDTIGDQYEAKVVLHDVRDMYTKRGVDQTSLEAATWSKAQSAPYPPAMLLTEAGLLWAGLKSGAGFYGMVLLLAGIFLLMSAWYFAQRRWYLFPLLYLNFSYLGYRFVYLQDCSYLVVLVVVTTALLLARAHSSVTHVLMAVAIDMKVTALYYASNLFGMKRRIALLFVLLLVSGLVLPYFLWDNYLYIFTFHDVKGHRYSLLGALILAGPVAAVLWYLDRTLGFDLEDRVGWSMVPCAMLVAWKMNAPRHLLMALLIPDKRGWRNAVAAAVLGLTTAWPDVVPFGATLPIATGLLMIILIEHLGRVGWRKVRTDFSHPLRTARSLLEADRRARRP